MLWRILLFALGFVGMIATSITFLGPINCDMPMPKTGGAEHVVWDLSTGHDIARVGWPPQVTDNIWFIDGPLYVHLILPDGESGDLQRCEKAQLRRDGNQLTHVSVMFPAETIEQCYVRTKTLARQWQITDLHELEEWHRTRGYSADQHSGYVALGRSDLRRPRGIELRHSFQQDKPWGVSFGFGYLPGWKENPTTAPSTVSTPRVTTGAQ
jgi:hypothetical protein